MRPAEISQTAALDPLAAAGVEEIELRLDEDYVAPLLRYFRHRAARR